MFSVATDASNSSIKTVLGLSTKLLGPLAPDMSLLAAWAAASVCSLDERASSSLFLWKYKSFKIKYKQQHGKSK